MIANKFIGIKQAHLLFANTRQLCLCRRTHACAVVVEFVTASVEHADACLSTEPEALHLEPMIT